MNREQQERWWWRVVYRCPRCGWVHEAVEGEKDQGPRITRDCPSCGYHLAVRPLDGRDLVRLLESPE